MPKGSYTISNWCHSSSFSRDYSSEQRNPKPSIRKSHPKASSIRDLQPYFRSKPSIRESHSKAFIIRVLYNKVRDLHRWRLSDRSEIFIRWLAARFTSDTVVLSYYEFAIWMIRELCASDLTKSADGDFVGLAKIGSEQFEDAMDDWGRRAVFRSNSIWAI
ncbi:hypothetical protein LXL04_019981 [Taraxacum kok-saghyz]